MKYRESGMPIEQQWNTFFDAGKVLEQMEVDNQIKTLMDIGCGFGTFLLPAAGLVHSKVLGIDIDSEMIATCQEKIRAIISQISI